MKILALTLCLMLTAFIIAPAAANAECMIGGNISVETCNNDLGMYCYTLEMTWDMDSPHGLSHFDLIVDVEGGTCSCADFEESIVFDAIAGSSDGEDDCMVDYTSELACNGDPSIDMPGIMFKFEPIEGDCEPGATGTGTFVFYSDLAAVPIDEQAFTIVDKAAQEFCTGTLTGVFPGMVCDPVANDELPLGTLKSLYR